MAPERVDDGVILPSRVMIGDTLTDIEVRFDEATGIPQAIRQVGHDWVDVQHLPEQLQTELHDMYDGGSLRFNPNTQRYAP